MDHNLPDRPDLRDKRPTDAALERRRRGRNIAMLVVLLALCALFYAIAMVKMAQVGHLPG